MALLRRKSAITVASGTRLASFQPQRHRLFEAKTIISHCTQTDDVTTRAFSKTGEKMKILFKNVKFPPDFIVR
jgi:hypothetical protein